ncbi:MAG: TetR/AcrR family transcriptional regulator [Lachnospiraceae bacterium]|nr:TetR/AcrR family transcriptional regulator [Lachnospiraceae bacterium]
MYKKMDDSGLEALLEAGIEEFSKKGLDRANINTIAKNANYSVGVIYKYYENKDQFFIACVEYSLRLLEEVMMEVFMKEEDTVSCISMILDKLFEESDSHVNYYVMYNEITSQSCSKYAVELARKIEGNTADIYRVLFERAQKNGQLRDDVDPRMCAFYFDSLLMMLQFSNSCEYYKERMKIFCGENILEDNKKSKENFIKFVSGALGLKV